VLHDCGVTSTREAMPSLRKVWRRRWATKPTTACLMPVRLTYPVTGPGGWGGPAAAAHTELAQRPPVSVQAT
jgi:hypothetical protein